MQSKINKRALRVWDRLIEAYGTRVQETYGPEIPHSWIVTVDDLTDEQIAYGLRSVQRESPVHPPTLPQFRKCCLDLPLQQLRGPTIQEQLCEYARLKLRGRLTQADIARPWTYMYREWRDETRPKGFENCAVCTGLLIQAGENDRFKISVADMQADTELHQRALRNFKEGPRPTVP